MTIAQILAEKQSVMASPMTPSDDNPLSANTGGSGTLRVRPSRLRHHDGNQNSFDSGP